MAKLVDDAVGIAKQQTRATIAYMLVAAFIVDALGQRFGLCSGEASGIKDLAIMAVSFYLGAKSANGKPPVG